MRRHFRFSLVPLICLWIMLMSVPVWAQGTVKIGVIGPMQFTQGKSMWNGAEMAAEKINAAGGMKVGSRLMKVELIKADSQEFTSPPEAAARVMDALITREKVDFVVGGFRTESVLAMQDVAMQHKVLFFGAGAAHPELCNRVVRDYNRYKYWFRGTPFNSNYMVKTLFMQVRSVAALLKQRLNLDRVKVAIFAETAMWVDPMVKGAEAFIPTMGLEVVGTWRVGDKATDVSAELAAIRQSGAHIIFTIFSGPAGIPVAKQAGEMKIPAVQVGINVESSKEGFWEATSGMGNYVMALNNYVRGVEYNDLTAEFVETYYSRYGELPVYNAATYEIIGSYIKLAVEEAGTLEADKLIPIIEEGVRKVSSGVIAFEKDEMGRPTHDLKWGPGYTTSLGTQWQDGKMVAVWPHFKWMEPYWEFSVEPPDQPNEMSYKGLKPFVIPPWMLAVYKN
jgi:branched-chain amino acid transport system substrate-binding protein